MHTPERHPEYRLLRQLARSRSFEVWEARAPGIGRVALKRGEGDPSLLHNEARCTARLHHPGIVQVLDLGTIEGRPFIVQELSPLGPLPDAAASRWEDAREVLALVLSALAHAHARGIIHRDLKPSNLLRFPDPPWVRIADFGIAARLEDASTEIAGTLGFCAPEQLRGEAPGPATDLYALGCLGWLLLTGAPPFEGSIEELVFSHQFTPPGPLRPVFACPPGIEGWLRWLLEKDPAARPFFAAEALAALRALDPNLPSVEDRPRPPPAGARLGALREPPLAGRFVEKDRLMQALQSLRGPRQLVLHGPPGSGKTALAEWLATMAHAEGIAVTARMGSGPASLVASALRCEGATAEQAARRVDEAIATSQTLTPYDRSALLELLRQESALSPAELRALLPRVLRHLSRDRPVVWLVEHQDLGVDLADLSDLDLLIIRTRQEPVEGGIALSPLPDEDAAALLRDLAPLSPPEIERLVPRGAGNPQLLVLLARDPVLPASLREAWCQRVLDLVPAPEALALAALLGRRVSRSRWQDACAAAGLVPPDLDPLLREGIVALEADGFRFLQDLAREALLDHPEIDRLRARIAGPLLARSARLLRIGSLAAAWRILEDLPPEMLDPEHRSTRWRLESALHLARGQPGLDAAWRAVDEARDPEARCLGLQQLALAMRRADADGWQGVRDRARALAHAHGLIEPAIHFAWATLTTLVREGRTDELDEVLAELQRLVPDPNRPQAWQVSHVASWVALKTGRLHEVQALAHQARDGAWAVNDRMSVYHSLTYEGDAMRLLGQPQAAEACFAEAMAVARASGVESGAIAGVNLAILRLHRGDADGARPLLEQALHHFSTQQRGIMEACTRLWLTPTLDGPEQEANLARVEALLGASPKGDPDLHEAVRFASERVRSPRLERLAQMLAIAPQGRVG